MADKRNDSAFKDLQAHHPQDLAAFLGFDDPAVRLLDTDIATVSGAVDGVLHIQAIPGRRREQLVHVEAQASHNPEFAARENDNTTLLRRKHGLPVRTVVLYLKPEAWRSSQNGVHREWIDGEEDIVQVFHYRVIRLWEVDPETLLQRLGTMPLATAAARTEAELKRVLERIATRIQREPDVIRGRLATASYVFTGLNFDLSLAETLIRRSPAMKESVTYQAIKREGHEEGREEGWHQAVLAFASARFGQPDRDIRQALEAIHDVERLKRMLANVEASSWHDLLNTP